MRPVPYHGGGFEGRDGHLIEKCSTAVCDSLVRHISASRVEALRPAWDEWAKTFCFLNRADDVPVEVARDFQSRVQRFASGLLDPFPLMRVTPKVHMLVNHTSSIFVRVGSLGSYAEQALEEWHGILNHAQAHCAVDSFLS